MKVSLVITLVILMVLMAVFTAPASAGVKDWAIEKLGGVTVEQAQERVAAIEAAKDAEIAKFKSETEKQVYIAILISIAMGTLLGWGLRTVVYTIRSRKRATATE